MSFCYNLISCNPSDYPDIENLCSDTRHGYEGAIVYIKQVYNGNLINSTQTYTLSYTGENTCVCTDWLPVLDVTPNATCTNAYNLWSFRNCETGEIRCFGFPDDPPQFISPSIGGCWENISECGKLETISPTYTDYESCTDCLTQQTYSCETDERSISYAVMIELPKPPPPDRGFDSCCYANIVLADTTDNDPYKNDFTGVYFKREIPNTTVSFKLVDTATSTEYDLNDSTYGTFQDFGGVQEDLAFYVLKWRNVLSLLGAGNYQLKKEITIAGVSIDYYSNTFKLLEFSAARADKTVRIDCLQDGLLVKSGLDFTGTGFVTSIRLRGFFGRPEYTFEQDNLVTNDYDSLQVSLAIDKEYQFQGLNIPDCIVRELMDFVILGNSLYISDYNSNNTSYLYNLLPVELSSNNGTDYFTLKREVNINLVFTDRFKDNRKINY